MLSYFRELYKYLHPRQSDLGEGLVPFHLQLLMLDEISKAMSSAMEGIDQTLDLICEAVTLILGVEKSLLLSLDPTCRRLVVHAARGMIDVDRVRAQEMPLDAGVIGLCIQGRKPCFGDVAAERDRTLRDLYQRLELQHFLAVPLTFGDRLLGVLIADTKLDHAPFNNADLKLINVLANLGAVARENAALISDLRTRNARLNALLEVSTAMSSTLDLNALLDLILERAIEMTQATTGAILLADDEGQQLTVQTSRGLADPHITLRPGQGITGWVMLEGASIRVPDVELDPRYYQANERVRSELAVPIRHQGRVVGIINVDSFTPDAFSSLHQQLLEILAAQAAVAIRNASMFTELRHQIGDG